MWFKAIVHTKIKTLSSYAHIHVFPNLYRFHSSADMRTEFSCLGELSLYVSNKFLGSLATLSRTHPPSLYKPVIMTALVMMHVLTSYFKCTQPHKYAFTCNVTESVSVAHYLFFLAFVRLLLIWAQHKLIVTFLVRMWLTNLVLISWLCEPNRWGCAYVHQRLWCAPKCSNEPYTTVYQLV